MHHRSTGGFNDIIQDVKKSGDVFRTHAIRNGVYRAYEGKDASGEPIPLGGIDYDPRTQLATGLGNVGMAGSITAGRDQLPPSGTAKQLAQDAKIVASSAVLASTLRARASHSPVLLQREEVLDRSDRLFRTLPGLLASEKLRRNGKIESDSLRLLLPDRLPGEKVVGLEEGVQFAGFTGIARPEAWARIGELEEHMVPKEKSTPRQIRSPGMRSC